MGVLSNNRVQIVAGGLISASFVSDLYDVFTGTVSESISISGSLNITGSIIGSLTGTATTASYVTGSTVNANTGSFKYVTVSSKFISEGTIFMYTSSLPISDPGTVNQLWRSGSYLMISTGSGS